MQRQAIRGAHASARRLSKGVQVRELHGGVVTRQAASGITAGSGDVGDRKAPTVGGGIAVPPRISPQPLPDGIHVRHAGAQSQAAVKSQPPAELLEELLVVPESSGYQNMDGMRKNDGRYTRFQESISSFIPKSRQYTDPVHTFAYGTDASFYRLNPHMVVKVHNEEEIIKILDVAVKEQTPVTFRAAGTSLSGQAITDSILLKISHTGKNFRDYEILNGGKQIIVEPGLIGGEVNRLLAAYAKKHKLEDQYKIGPDPSSIDSCMMGGIVANNSSGMCCGVSQNSYHTVKDLRIVLVDGTILDTANAESKASFLKTHKHLVEGVVEIARRIQSDEQLAALIRRKYAIKCTTGYSLNALVDFPVSDPIEIIKRLMIGSEGTLAFVSSATYNTVPDYAYKASAFMVFPTVELACEAANVLRKETGVDAVEMFDPACLRECKSNDGMVKEVHGLMRCDEESSALLIECRGKEADMLQANIDEVINALKKSNTVFSDDMDKYPFRDGEVSKLFWDVRKGLIPLVGGAREAGTSMLIEDVACPVENLGPMTRDLINMFKKFEYHDASCFGHALEGNLHLVFSQGFRNDEEVDRYSRMMQELCELVADKYGGSLKAEHGTGRNVAPFVEMEWGAKATDIMWELKDLFDPSYVLNPGVILNRDMDVHRKHLKPSPKASSIVDRCIECGFCESNCPAKDLSLTPRQRITVWREIKRLDDIPEKKPAEVTRLDEFKSLFAYYGEATCAADGMCQEKCPVKINTGDMIKQIRAEEMQGGEHKKAEGVAMKLANNMPAFNSYVPKLLNTVDLFHGVLGHSVLEFVSSQLNTLSGNVVPTWNKYMPKGSTPLKTPAKAAEGALKVVYMPTCVTRTMGPARGDTETGSVHDKLLSLFEKAGYEVIYPENISSQCCGMLFNSRGFKEAAGVTSGKLEEALLKASDGGRIPIVCDTSPCLAAIKDTAPPALKLALHEPVEFISKHLMDKLDFTKARKSIAIHVPCSSKKMGIESSFLNLAKLCADEVHPSGVPCCGMAGDRGLRYPELTASSLQHLNLPSDCTDGYSSSRTCEMSLSNHSGVNFRGMVYLVDECTTPKQQEA